MAEWESKTYIWDEMVWHTLWQKSNTTHRQSGECATWTRVNDHCHVASIHASSCTSLCSDNLRMVQTIIMTYNLSWKLRWFSFIRNGEDVGLYISETSGWYILLLIPSWKRKNMIDIRHSAFTGRVYWWLRYWEGSKLLDANHYT